MIYINENNTGLLNEAEHIGIEITSDDECKGERYYLKEDKCSWTLVRNRMGELEQWSFNSTREGILNSIEADIKAGDCKAYAFESSGLLQQWVNVPNSSVNYKYARLMKEEFIGICVDNERRRVVLGEHLCATMDAEEDIHITRESKESMIRILVTLEEQGCATIFTFNSQEELDKWVGKSESYKANQKKITELKEEMTEAYEELEKKHKLLNELFAQATREMAQLDQKSREYEFGDDCIYIARDSKDNTIWVYSIEPRYKNETAQYMTDSPSTRMRLPTEMFPEITAESGVYRLVLEKLDPVSEVLNAGLAQLNQISQEEFNERFIKGETR